MEGLVPIHTALTATAMDIIEPRVGRMSLALAQGVKATRTSGKGEFAVEIGVVESATVEAGIKMRTAIVLLVAEEARWSCGSGGRLPSGAIASATISWRNVESVIGFSDSWGYFVFSFVSFCCLFLLPF